MVRVKQFADDLAISTKKAKDLINKGRNRKDGGSQILESVMKPKKYGSGGSNKVVLPKPRPKNLKKKKTSEQIVKEANEYEITKSDITESLDEEFSRKVAKQNEEAMKNVKKKKAGGVLKMSRGGGMAIQGLGFKGVR